MGRPPAPSEGEHELPVAVVGQQGERLLRLDPAELVDLVVRDEGRLVDHLHRPVAHQLGPPANLVLDGRKLSHQRAAQAGLLLDLAQGGVLEGLAVVELPLRKRPVVLPGPVHERNEAVAQDHPAGCLYGVHENHAIAGLGRTGVG